MDFLPATEENIKKTSLVIREGGVIIYPTETYYGLGCAPKISEAAKRICIIKERTDKPLPLICANINEVKRIVEFSKEVEKLADKFWPGPLTIISLAKVEYSIWITHGAKTLGVRIPGSDIARKLACLSGGVLVSTSANKSGQPPHDTALKAANELGKHVDIVLDGGITPGGDPSTIVDLSGKHMRILRKGPVKSEDIKEVLDL